MRPIKLVLRGINSFEKEQTVDFEGLTSAGLFGIFGPTGSGKSTIIDACTMALYSEMPRQSGRECVNSGCAEMFLYLEFELSGVRYAAERLYARDSKGLRQKRARLYKKSGEVISDKPSEVTAAVINLIGLNYKDFSRSVVLPQGKFSEFLTLGERDRSDMLERIFGLEEYGDKLIKNLKNKKREHDTELALTESELTFFGDLSEEKLKEEETALALESLKLAELKLKHEKTLTSLDKKRGLLKLADELAGYEKEYDGLTKAREEIEQKRARLSMAEKSAVIMPFVVTAEETTAKITALKKRLEENKSSLAEANEALLRTRNAADEAAARKDAELPELIGLETRLGQAMETAVEYNRVKAERDSLLNEYKNSTEQKSKLIKKRDEKIARKEAIKAELTSLAERRTAIALSPETRQRIITAYGLARDEKKLTEQASVFESRYAKLKADIDNCINEKSASTKKLALLTAERENLKNEIDLLNARRPEPRSVYELREKLRDGQPCPVCGSTSHPYGAPDADENNSAAAQSAPLDPIKEWEREKALADKKLEQNDAETGQLNIKIAALDGKLENNESQINEINRDKGAAARELNALAKELASAREGLPEGDVSTLYSELSQRDTELETIQTKEAALRKKDENLDIELESLNREAAELDNNIQGLLVRGGEKKERLKEMSERLSALTGGRDAASYLAETKAKIAALSKTADDAKALYTAATERHNILGQTVEADSAGLAALEGVLLENNKKISGLLTEHNLKEINQVKEGWMADTGPLADEINRYDGRVRDMRANMERVRALILETPGENIPRDEIADIVSRLESEREAEASEIERGTETTAVSRKKIETMRENLKKTNALHIKKKNLTHKLDLLNDLDGLFRGNEFVKYISRQHLRNIVREASRRMKEMTSGRYQMELDDTEFIIRDDFNGGSRRSPRTLSGGETFIASLSLALALSSRLQLKNRTPLEFFFLDEGFGTLDNSFLDTVMNCLEKLRSEKMSVGVISHVEELKNRVPVKLNLYNDGINGSLVSHNYGNNLN